MFFYFIIFIVLILALFACIAIVLKSTLSLRLSCFASPERFEFIVHVYFWNKERWFIRLTEKDLDRLVKQMAKKKQAGTEGEEENVSLPFRNWKVASRFAVRLLRVLRSSRDPLFHDLSWNTSCGLGEAHRTAIICGLIRSAKSVVLLPFSELIDGNTRIHVVPVFQEEYLTSRLSCMITLKVGETMVIIRKIRQLMKEGEGND
ncbi:DUF2953 domain-containing protein [Sporolactobacillus sp. THM7-7]|nr:DUF2953 domain-containing protein [Sporolactobacillus sp. THM7-7]